MDRIAFIHLFNRFFIPLKDQKYPQSHRLHMDNAPSHVSGYSRQFFNENNINHFKTPAQSPDLNPIEMVWHDLKVFIGEEIKPNNERELIREFWNEKVTIEYCNREKDHLERVIETILTKNGKATGL